MLKLAATLLMVLSPMATSAADASCEPFSGSVPDALDVALEPGKYELVLVATEGSQEGRKAVGFLHLHRTSPQDRSPSTGEGPEDDWRSEIPLYGWTDVDFDRIGAPLCREEPHPSPDSQDPIYPGVLVHLLGAAPWLPRRPEDAPVLTIATLSNVRSGGRWLDGCGIALIVKAAREEEFIGRWVEWGIVANGRGEFCLRPAVQKQSNSNLHLPSFARR